MFAALVKDKRAQQTFMDKLESFFYVILWLALMYLSNSMFPPNLTFFVWLVLDLAEYQATGGNSKAKCLVGCTDLLYLSFLRQPLHNDLAMLFVVCYERKPSNEEYEVLVELEHSQHHFFWLGSIKNIFRYSSHKPTPMLLSWAATNVAC